jgi:hypothetical protein
MFWQTGIGEKVTPKQFDDRKLMPRPRSIEDFLLMFTYASTPGRRATGRCLCSSNFPGGAGRMLFCRRGRRVNRARAFATRPRW